MSPTPSIFHLQVRSQRCLDYASWPHSLTIFVQGSCDRRALFSPCGSRTVRTRTELVRLAASSLTTRRAPLHSVSRSMSTSRSSGNVGGKRISSVCWRYCQALSQRCFFCRFFSPMRLRVRHRQWGFPCELDPGLLSRHRHWQHALHQRVIHRRTWMFAIMGHGTVWLAMPGRQSSTWRGSSRSLDSHAVRP